MSEARTKICPDCNGRKEIEGQCVCDNEWRGTEKNGEWEDCHCTPTVPCPTCNGTGYIEDSA